MAISNFPPQAFTKEMLSDAFSWLSSQPEDIRKLATSPDTLISLYKRAHRGDSHQPKPSAALFKTELKNLAGEMKKFDQPAVQVQQKTEPAHASSPGTNYYQAPSNPGMIAPSHQQGAPSQIGSSPALGNVQKTSLLRDILDEKSWTMLLEAKNEFNLSTEEEALRLLISSGYKRISRALT